MVLVASTDVMMLRIVQPLLNNIGTVDKELIGWLPYAIVGVFVLRGIGSYASEYGLAWIGSHVVYDLRCEACDHLLRLPTPFYDRSSAGFLLSKVTFDAQQISATASEAITVSIRNTLTIVFMLGYLLYINWQLTLIAFTAFPAVAYALRKIRRRMKKVSGMVQERTGSLTHRLEEAIGAHRVVKIFGGEAYESNRLREAANRLRLASGEAGGRRRARDADQPDHRVDRGRRDSLCRAEADDLRHVRRRRLHRVHLCAAASADAAQDAIERDERDAARDDRGGKRLRADRRAAGSPTRGPGSSRARRAASASIT